MSEWKLVVPSSREPNLTMSSTVGARRGLEPRDAEGSLGISIFHLVQAGDFMVNRLVRPASVLAHSIHLFPLLEANCEHGKCIHARRETQQLLTDSDMGSHHISVVSTIRPVRPRPRSSSEVLVVALWPLVTVCLFLLIV